MLRRLPTFPRPVERLLALVILTWLVVFARRLRRSGERAAVRPR